MTAMFVFARLQVARFPSSWKKPMKLRLCVSVFPLSASAGKLKEGVILKIQ